MTGHYIYLTNVRVVDVTKLSYVLSGPLITKLLTCAPTKFSMGTLWTGVIYKTSFIWLYKDTMRKVKESPGRQKGVSLSDLGIYLMGLTSVKVFDASTG